MKKPLIVAAVAAVLIALAVLFSPSTAKQSAQSTPAPTPTATPNAQTPADPSLPAITAATLLSSVDQKTVPVQLPYTKQRGARGELLDFTITLAFSHGQSTIFEIIPDDCVDEMKVNDMVVPLAGQAEAKRCNWRTGFAIDLQNFLKPGDNVIKLRIRNVNGPTGLHFKPLAQAPH